MAKTPNQRLRLPQRQRERTQALYDLFAFMIDHKDFVLAEHEQVKEMIEKAEKAAKEKAEKEYRENHSIFRKKMTFGQTLIFTFCVQAITTFLALAIWFR